MKSNEISLQEGKRRIQEINSNVSRSVINKDSETKQIVGEILCRILKMESNELNTDLTFKEMGVDSISGVEIIRDINQEFGLNLDSVEIYEYPTIADLVNKIIKEVGDYAEGRQQDKRLNKQYEYMDSLVNKFSYETSEAQAPLRSEPPLLDTTFPSKQSDDSQNQSHTKMISLEDPKIPSINLQSQTHRGTQLKLSNTTDDNIIRQIESEIAAEVHNVNSANRDNKSRVEKKEKKEGIAIIGISGRFPGARNVRLFWNNLREGYCSIDNITSDRFDISSHYDPNKKTKNKSYNTVAGMLDEIDTFDPLFFNISPKEADIMDPQQRIFLEEAWHALEDAGYADYSMKEKKCGVFVGCAPSDYTKNLDDNNMLTTSEGFLGTSTSILASRIAYHLNLKGPSVAIDTACSSSLVAVSLACDSLWDHNCDMALAGGIRLIVSPDIMVQSSQMEILSPTQVCRPFDNNADGTILGEGVGVCVLKPLSRAIENHDYIYGVIRGAGVNQDGKTNGITAPSATSQTALELDVYNKFQIDPSEINYVEAHGTGTKLGDPIEVKALTEAFRAFTDNRGYCAIGSVKANIGHTTMAAGIVSIIKVLLAMKHQKIPPLINHRKVNEEIALQSSPFYINTSLIAWPKNQANSRMAAISGFGFSGTNCHIVIEDYTN